MGGNPSAANRQLIADQVLAQFAASQSNLHLGGTSDWSVSEETIRFLARWVTPGAVTLETGAGLSSIAFAALGARHICVCPDDDEISRIRAYCERQSIGLGDVTFLNKLSEDALPSLVAPPLDLVLIDGGHGFPMPVIDWYFTAGKLKEGGVLIIDDTHLWSCGMLVDFLKHDDAWKSLGPIGRRTFAFQKVAAFEYKEFCFQPYVVRRSRIPSLVSKALVAWDLVRSGQGAEFMKRLKRSGAAG